MKSLLSLIVLALIASTAIYYYQNIHIVSVPGNTISAEFETATNTETVADDSQVESQETEDPAPIPGGQGVLQDQAYCGNLGPQTGNAANSTFFTSELVDGTSVTNGYLLRGCVKNVAGFYGNWGPFEGQVGTYKVIASDSTILSTGVIPTSGPFTWLDYANAGQHIPYEQVLIFNPGSYTTGTIEIKNENPSGETPMDETKTFTVSF